MTQPASSALRDNMLIADMSNDDCIYRFQRDYESYSTIIYVHLKQLDIIPEENLTWSRGVVNALKAVVPVWNEGWTTLNVDKQNGEVRWEVDAWTPRSIKSDSTWLALPRLNFVEADDFSLLKHGVRRIRYAGKRQIMKDCYFQWLLKYMEREIRAYCTLLSQNCPLIPRLSAFVYERTEEELIGFVCEELEGRTAGPEDYDECKKSLTQLHTYGVIHGDINRFNIIITATGPRFIDLEKAIFRKDEHFPDEEFIRRQQVELVALQAALNSEEDWGRPLAERGLEESGSPSGPGILCVDYRCLRRICFRQASVVWSTALKHELGCIANSYGIISVAKQVAYIALLSKSRNNLIHETETYFTAKYE